MRIIKKNTFHLAISSSVVGIVFLVFSRFVIVPNQLSTYAEVFPKEKWLLTRGNGGQIISNLIDYSEGQTTNYNITQFERGESVIADFGRFLKGKKEFEIGDTIVKLQSSYVSDELVTTEGELGIAYANLKSQSSSEKESLIREAESRLNYYEVKLAEEKVSFERTQKLFEKGFASQQEYELGKLNLNLLETEVKMYGAQIDNLTTGVKPEEVKLLQSRIKALQTKIKFLQDRESQLVFVSPIKGRIVPSFSPDTLLNLTNNEKVVLHIPIKVKDRWQFQKNQNIVITLSSLAAEFNGSVINIGDDVKLVNGQQVIFISLLINNSKGHLLSGMIIENSIKLGEITLFEKLYNSITR